MQSLQIPCKAHKIPLAANRKDIIGDYKHPMILTALGWIMVLVTAWMGLKSLSGIMKMFG